jgi:hypothetical protein
LNNTTPLCHQADSLERFLSVKFPSSKRFGLEGCEALLPGLHALIRASAGHGVERIMLGMAHRWGRSLGVFDPLVCCWRVAVCLACVRVWHASVCVFACVSQVGEGLE